MGLSTNTTTYAGGAQTFAVNFALGFLSRADVQVRVNAAVDGSGDPVYTSFSWIDDSAISVIPTLTIGDTVEVLRTVSKTELAANFAANTDVTPANLDVSAKQGLMIYQELIDGRVEGTESPIVAGNRAEAAALAAEASAAAALASEGVTDADVIAAAASAAAALVSENAAAADLVLTNADVVSTNADAVATAADLVQTNIDQLAVAADLVATNQDTIDTAADVVLTNADVISAAASAAAAASSYDSFDDRYLGSKASAPTLDNDGDAILTGALYWNSSSSGLFIYTGSAWSTAAFDPSGALVSTNNLSDVANAATARNNLGLGTAATTASSAYATAAQGTLADSALQAASTLDASNLSGTAAAINGSAITNLTSGNLVGALPAIDGSALTGVGGGSPSLFSIRDEKATNTVAQTLSAATWNIRDLQTTDVNTLTGASLAANVITLPEGTFDVDGMCKAYRSNGTKARLYDITNSTTILVSTVDGGHSSFYTGVDLHLIGRITVASGGITCRVEQHVQTASAGGVGAFTTSETCIYSYIKFTEVT